LGAGKNGEDMGAYPAAPADGYFIRGDANADGAFDISDAISVLFYLFSGGASTPRCLDALDADDTGTVDITDPLYILGALFQNGPVPPAPFPDPGTDPTTGDPYDCASP
jgi:hypothetical protein